MRRFEDIVLDLEIFEQELNRRVAVGFDSANLCRSQHNMRRFRFLKERAHRTRIAQISFGPRPGDDVDLVAALFSFFQRTNNGAANQTAMTGNENAVVTHRTSYCRIFFPLISCASISMSASVMSVTSSLNFVFGSQPNCFFALEASPSSSSTSAGR